MLAVRDTLQEALGVDRTVCDVSYADGMPPASSGQEFIAVCEGEWRGLDQADYGLRELYGVEVIVTRRLGSYPLDRIGSDVLTTASKGMNARLAQVRAALHMNYGLLLVANKTINDAAEQPENGFIEALRFRGVGRSQIKGQSWLHAESDPDDEEGREECALVRSASFGGAERDQLIPTMT